MQESSTYAKWLSGVAVGSVNMIVLNEAWSEFLLPVVIGLFELKLGVFNRLKTITGEHMDS